jgi:riboflavin biosynthesis pyrimidine reductase
LLGPQARPLLDLEEIRELRQAPGFVIMEFVRIGEDLRLRLRPNHGNGVAAL